MNNLCPVAGCERLDEADQEKLRACPVHGVTCDIGFAEPEQHAQVRRRARARGPAQPARHQPAAVATMAAVRDEVRQLKQAVQTLLHHHRITGITGPHGSSLPPATTGAAGLNPRSRGGW